MNRVSISQSDGINLQFEDEALLKEYEEKLLKLQIATYKKIKKVSGVWASNQNKFVRNTTQFNNSDSYHMEIISRKKR